MAIVRINLLPHREQRRQARQRQFVSLAVVLAALSLAIILLVHGVFSAQIENQKSRNALLKTEIAKLDEQIKEIDRLREQIQAVISRKQVVETLQANRSEAVHLRHHYIGTEHILLGLIREGDGLAAKVLVDGGYHLGGLRTAALTALRRAA